mmetsp:Transcript_39527/g.38001  ORF Transcript_39527/g.38001 Transcript_39527/m.38001 type:complete len:307 (-) Transcript_39527:30-950(-)
MVTIDQTFKGDGGIGGFLQKSYPKDMSSGQTINYGRFIFDNFFNILLVILVVEIISGIIIDTFGALREEHNKITESIENKCMICGKNRDLIEREQQERNDLEKEENNLDVPKISEEKAFDYHKKELHNIYDYIFFLAYLQEKPELEYTGLESFVSEKYNDHNNTWFPIYKVGRGSKGEDKADKGGPDEGDNDEEQEDDDEESSSEEEQESKKRTGKGVMSRQNYQTMMEQLQEINGKLTFICSQQQEEDDFEPEELPSNRFWNVPNLAVGTLTTPTQRESHRGTKNMFQKYRTKLMAINAFKKKSN